MKRDKQDVAILILSILVAALLITFLVVKVFDLKIGKTDVGTQQSVSPSDDAQQEFPFSDTPEIILGSGDAQAWRTGFFAVSGHGNIPDDGDRRPLLFQPL